MRIKRNAGLEKLLIARRSAKIASRRATIALDHEGASSTPTSVDLFKRITNKPFAARRRSVCTRMTTAQSDEIDGTNHVVDLNEVDQSHFEQGPSGMQKSVGGNNRSVIVEMTTTKPDENGLTDDNIDTNEVEEINSEPETSGEQTIGPVATTSNDVSDRDSTLNDAEMDKENCAPPNTSLDDILLPFLPSVEPPMCVNTVSTLLDSIIPNALKLPAPITPIASKMISVNVEKDLMCMEDSLPTPSTPIASTMPTVVADKDLMCKEMSSVMDSFVPNSINLPAPIQPESRAKRAVPGLIPFCDLIAATTKNYGRAKRLSNTSQLILGTLNKFEEQKHEAESFNMNQHTVPAENISIDQDEGFRLFYSDDSDDNEPNEKNV